MKNELDNQVAKKPNHAQGNSQWEKIQIMTLQIEIYVPSNVINLLVVLPPLC